MHTGPEVTSVVVQNSDGVLQSWHFRQLSELGLKETHLEEAIHSHPKSLVVEPLGLFASEFVSCSQPVLKTSSDSRRRPDIIIVTNQADVIVVEVKLGSNIELQDGKRAIAQCIEYAALLSSVSESNLVEAFTKGEHSSWEQVCHGNFDSSHSSRQIANQIRQRIHDGEVHLVIACDSAPADLAEIVRAAGNLSALAFTVHVIEVRPMVPDVQIEKQSRPIVWVPLPQLETAIVHRTAVTVRAEGFATNRTPSFVVDVTSDSADVVEKQLANPRGRRSRRNYVLEMQSVIEPLAESLDLEAEALWTEIEQIQVAVEEEDWDYLREAIALPDDEGPHVRKRLSEGRYGVNLLKQWEPSVFVGAYLLADDHKAPLLEPDQGGDFALIIDVGGNAREKRSYCNHDQFKRLRRRLSAHRGKWRCTSTDQQPDLNPWHPLMLRRPLQEVLRGAYTIEARQTQWLKAAHDAVALLLDGGELERIGQVSSDPNT